jgi:chorismate dehydratase
MENLRHEKIRVSAVSYLNTLPLIYGLTHSKIMQKIKLTLDNPSVCAKKLIDDEVDLGLIPIASIPQVSDATIISSYCIGADGPVKTVLLLSDYPLEELSIIYLDTESRTSVKLVQVLAERYWKRKFEWKSMLEYKGGKSEKAGFVLIGNKTFIEGPKFKYSIDLAAEWKKFTGLPFVFACWVANKRLPQEFVDDFDHSMKLGLTNIDASIEESDNGLVSQITLSEYLKHSISYNFDTPKKEAMKLFLKFDKELFNKSAEQ